MQYDPRAVAELQKRLGVEPTGQWNPITRGAIGAFAGTARVDPPSLVALKYYNPLDALEPDWADYVGHGGERPGTFGRDLAGVNAALPYWGWLLIGGALIGGGYLAFRASRKKK